MEWSAGVAGRGRDRCGTVSEHAVVQLETGERRIASGGAARCQGEDRDAVRGGGEWALLCCAV